MFESKDSTLGIYKKQLSCSPAATCGNTTRKHVGRFLKERCVPITYLTVKGYDDTYNMFMVKYDYIKPF